MGRLRSLQSKLLNSFPQIELHKLNLASFRKTKIGQWYFWDDAERKSETHACLCASWQMDGKAVVGRQNKQRKWPGFVRWKSWLAGYFGFVTPRITDHEAWLAAPVTDYRMTRQLIERITKGDLRQTTVMTLVPPPALLVSVSETSLATGWLFRSSLRGIIKYEQ